jgi:hypothetical protein
MDATNTMLLLVHFQITEKEIAYGCGKSDKPNAGSVFSSISQS